MTDRIISDLRLVVVVFGIIMGFVQMAMGGDLDIAAHILLASIALEQIIQTNAIVAQTDEIVDGRSNR